MYFFMLLGSVRHTTARGLRHVIARVMWLVTRNVLIKIMASNRFSLNVLKIEGNISIYLTQVVLAKERPLLKIILN